MGIYGQSIFCYSLLESYYNTPEIIFSESEIQEFYNILNEEMDADEGYGAKLRPVFIVLLYSDSTFDKVVEKFVKGQSYWHAAISFGPALSRCYSFNFGEANANKIKGGLSFESIDFYKKAHPTATCEISCILLNKEKYARLKEALYFYMKNKEKTKYSFINLIYSLFGKKTKNGLKFNLVCSTFVDTILKYASIDLNGKQTNLVKPDDLKVTKEHEKQFKIFEGKVIDYDKEKMRLKVEKLANDANNDYFSNK